MHILAILSSTVLFGALSVAAACAPPQVDAPVSIVYKRSPIGFTFDGYTNPGCRTFDITFVDTTTGVRTLASYTVGATSTHLTQIVPAPPGEYYVEATVRGSTPANSISTIVTTSTFTVQGSTCQTPLLTTPVAGDRFGNNPTSFTFTDRNTDCSRVRVFHTLVGGVENSTVFSQSPRSDNQGGVNLVGGEYDVSIQSFEPTGSMLPSPRSTPVRITIIGKCSTPAFTAPVNGQVFNVDPAGLYAQMSNVDCDYVYYNIFGIDSGYGYAHSFNMVPGETTGSTFYSLPSGHYSVISYAGSSDGARLSSDASESRTFVVDDPKCTVPVLVSPTWYSTSIALPSGFDFEISSTDCRTVTLIAEHQNSQYVLTLDLTLDPGQSSVSSNVEVPAGQYYIYVKASDEGRNPSERSGGVYIYVEAPKCPRPTIVRPSPYERFQTLPGATTAATQYEIITTSPCTDIFIIQSVPGANDETYTLSDSTTYTPTRDLIPGSYALYAIARDPSTDLPESLQISTYFTVDPPNCDVSGFYVAGYDPQPETTEGSFYYQASYGNCRRLSLYLNGVLSVQHDNDVGTTFFGEYLPLPTGSYEAYIVAEYIPTSSIDPHIPEATSVTLQFTIHAGTECTAPTITSPQQTDPYPILTRQFIVTGTTTEQGACTTVGIYTVGDHGEDLLVGSGLRLADNTFSVQASQPLSVGGHYIFARSIPSDGTRLGDQSNTVYIIVEEAPTPTGYLSLPARRKIYCKRNEDACTVVDTRGRKSVLCVPDLDSNLEQCGSCGGPDCTLLANVDDVACTNGRCLVSSCLEGYTLEHNTCKESLDFALFVQGGSVDD